MNILSWNCRGLGNPRSVWILGDLIKSRKPNFLFLSETLVMSDKIKELCFKFKFVKYFVVDCIGRSGGLAILWRKNFDCSVLDSSANHIDVQVNSFGNVQWRMTCFYGFPERSRRRDSWNFIKSLAAKSDMPWCILGDFNDMMYAADKKGDHAHPQYLLNGFSSTIKECHLMELDLKGGNYTWEKSRGTQNWVRERLDRAFATEAWWHMFPLCNLTVHNTICSDHEPILLELISTSHSKQQFRFRFENTWLKEDSFTVDVTNFWKSLKPTHLMPKLISVSSFMAKWGRNFFHKFRDKVKHKKEEVNLYADCEDEEGVRKFFEATNQLNDLLSHEEVYWKQRAKAFWLEEGDSNSKFFHAFANARKKVNQVTRLKNNDGEVIVQHEEMCNVVKEYFKAVFENTEVDHDVEQYSTDAVITSDQNEVLTADFTYEEFSDAVK
ncbi:uncharacterized protein LOC141673107 [Apium graveolens]|uniref:uncharacterized protein LOC141673107 n=1 Tax=Apium graveolens TaxID=4045 RepID=UPI003D7B280E